MSSTPCLLMRGIREVSVGQIELPGVGPGEVLVKTLYSGVSPGTELRCFTGDQENAPSEPFVSGYALVGRVVRTGDQCKNVSVGDNVFLQGSNKFSGAVSLWGGHVGGAVVSEEDLFKLPDGLSPLVAVLAKLAAIAYHGLRWTKPLPHERVAVIGLGPLGLISALLHKLTGAEVLAVDRVPVRAALGREVGLDAVAATDSAAQAVHDHFGKGVDIVVDCTGASAALSSSIECLEAHPWNATRIREQRLLVQGSYPAAVCVDYHTAFMKETSLRFTRDNDTSDVLSVLRLMGRGLLRPQAIISEVVDPKDAPRLYAELESKNHLVTAAFQWD